METPSTTAHDVEAHLRRNSAPALFPGASPGLFVLPDYGGRSLASVPATIAQLLGTPLQGIAPPLDGIYWRDLSSGIERVVLVLLDALGYLPFTRWVAEQPASVWGRLIQRGILMPMTSVFPSTTANALATLATGMEPIAHGLLGYELFLREYGILTEMLSLRPVYSSGKETLLDWGLDPESFLPVPGIGTLLTAQGIQTTAYVPAAFVKGGLTRMCYRGFGQILGFADVEALFSMAQEALRHEQARPAFHYLYWGGIDKAIHTTGNQNGQWQAALANATRALEERFLARLTPRERDGTLLIMIADHGFVDAPLDLAHDTERDPLLQRELLAPFSGEARAAYLHTLAGNGRATLQAVRAALGPNYYVHQSSALVDAGLFGAQPAAPEALARLGHLIAIPRGLHYLDRKGLSQKLRGRHGGLSAEEMLVPWLAVRLDA
jgi:hypothetical protein